MNLLPYQRAFLNGPIVFPNGSRIVPKDGRELPASAIRGRRAQVIYDEFSEQFPLDRFLPGEDAEPE